MVKNFVIGARLRLVPACAVGLAVAIMALLRAFAPVRVYEAPIRFLGIIPFRFPFVDTDTVMSAARCLHAHVDVYVTNPCDPLGRLFDYSPLWMVLAILPSTAAWLPWMGLIVVGLFLFALTRLPPARDAAGLRWILAGTLSSGVCFAVERGNNDLVLFALVAGAGALLARAEADPSRPGLAARAYPLLVLAGLLKYYPMATMAVAFRERTPHFLAAFAASVLITLVFAIVTWADLSRALAIIPIGWPYGDMFGAITLGLGIVTALGLPRETAHLVEVPMMIAAAVFAWRLARRPETREALARLLPAERVFLVLGTLLVAGAFFTAQNIGYRVVHLLLVLPALVALRGDTKGPTRARLLAAAPIALLWSEFLRHPAERLAVKAGSPEIFSALFWAIWTLREVIWWWLMVRLLGFLLAWLMESPLLADYAPRAHWLARLTAAKGSDMAPSGAAGR